MPQGLLPYELSLEPITSRLTAFAGLPVYLVMTHVTRLVEVVRRHAPVRGACDKGFTDAQMILALILLNLAGGECVDDVERLEGDRGLA